MRDQVRDRTDAHVLLNQLENEHPQNYLESIRYQASIRHVQHLLDGLYGDEPGPYSINALQSRLDAIRDSFKAVQKPRVASTPAKPPKPTVPVIAPKPFEQPFNDAADGDQSLVHDDESMIDHGSVPSSPVPPPPPRSPLVPPPPTTRPKDLVEDKPRQSRPALVPVPSAAEFRQRKQQEAAAATALTPPAATASSSALMEHHASLQNSLLSSLTSMSSQLKFNTMSFSQSLAEDKEVMEGAQRKLETNYDKMKQQGGRLDTLRKKSRGTTCAMVGIVASVAVAWVVMLGLIKIT